jgi:hypothetical protein
LESLVGGDENIGLLDGRRLNYGELLGCPFCLGSMKFTIILLLVLFVH